MSIDSTWLRCPNCSLPLSEIAPGVLGCDAGHRFDVTKFGTVTLLPPRAPHTIGDSRQMLDARAELLGTGAFEPIAEAIGQSVESLAPTSPRRPLRIIDLGCGTGYYSSRLASRLVDAAFLVADRSPIAVRIATRSVPNATGVVLDLWRPLPIRDQVADVSVNVFAPRNPDEFARITRRGGALVVVVPTDRHLGELRSHRHLLEIPSGKAEHVTQQLASAGLTPVSRQSLEYRASMNEPQLNALIAMGPSAHHAPDGRVADDGEASRTERLGSGREPAARTDVTVSVDVLAFHRG